MPISVLRTVLPLIVRELPSGDHSAEETRPASAIAFLRAGETVDGKGEESKLGVYGAEELREEEANKY